MSEHPAYIRVEGLGLVTAVPDRITLSFNIQELHRQYKDCLEGLANRVHHLKADILGCGLSTDQLKTGHFQVNPEYDYHEGQQVFRGYRASQQLSISMEMDKSKLAEVLAALSQSESKSEFNIQFGLKNDQHQRLEAIAGAVAQAKQHAQALADAATVRLGALRSMTFTPNTNAPGGGLDVHMMAMKSAAPLEIDPADLRIEARVVVEWDIAG